MLGILRSSAMLQTLVRVLPTSCDEIASSSGNGPEKPKSGFLPLPNSSKLKVGSSRRSHSGLSEACLRVIGSARAS